MRVSQPSPVLEDTLQRAGFEAAELKHELREPGHLLISIMAMPKNYARTTLEAFRIDIGNLRKIVEGKYPQSNGLGSFIDISSPATFDVLETTEYIAQQDSNYTVVQRPDHLLKALVVTDPVVVVILVDLGVSPKDILRRLDQEIAG